jgi:3-dehydroquinate dehydratase II
LVALHIKQSCRELAEILLDIDIFINIRQNLDQSRYNEQLMKKILVLHGPNLNLLGHREPSIYGLTSLDEINRNLIIQASQSGCELHCHQSNSETELIQAIHKALTDNVSYIIFNPAGYTHTSIALRDALCAVAIPFVEVHISNLYSREAFRHQSYFSDIAQGIISGFGTQGYLLALQAITKTLESIDTSLA